MVNKYSLEIYGSDGFSYFLERLMKFQGFTEYQIISICRVDKDNYEIFVKE